MFGHALQVGSLLAVLLPAAAPPSRVPSIDRMLGLEWPDGARISPDGKYVAYEVQTTDWEANDFPTHLRLAVTATGRTYRLTSGKGSSHSPRWSPDGKALAFTSDRSGKMQVYLIAPDGGEAVALTNHETAVGACEWSPDGKSLVFTAPDPEGKERKERREKYGSFEVFGVDHPPRAHLWRVEVPPGLPAKPPKAERLTEGSSFSVSGAPAFSPDGKKLAFSALRNPVARDFPTRRVYVLTLADRSVKRLPGATGPGHNPTWSPDGKQLAYERGHPDFTYRNSVVAVVPAGGGAARVLTAGFDENPTLHAWGPGGLYFSALQKTNRFLYRLDPGSEPVRLGAANAWAYTSYSLTRDRKRVAFVHAAPDGFPEVCVASTDDPTPRPLTQFGKQLRGYALGRREVVRWKSADGTPVEGVLTRPADFERGKKYPLLVVIHGGPQGVDTPARPSPFAYPLEQFVARGALVLQPNYRGSAGYGEKFRSLNVRNLGVGDYDDVIGGVDHLIARGMVDRDRVGAMGWSQGGYISAYITCFSDRFKAVSVGAGISDWTIYYCNTDIPPFTRQYLRATPWDDPEVYRRTSPLSYLKRARTPTLIQHGDRDARVPIPNAHALYRALKDRGVPVRLIVYKGHGHGIYKPREQRALMEQNYEWFGEHLWGDKPRR